MIFKFVRLLKIFRVVIKYGLDEIAISGLRVPRTMASTWARSSIACGTSAGRPMLMTNSRLGSLSATIAMLSTSASLTRRRAPPTRSHTYRQSEPVPK